ncbi:hypothetical protein OSTOST_08299 [Ostertagia ostertagi]
MQKLSEAETVVSSIADGEAAEFGLERNEQKSKIPSIGVLFGSMRKWVYVQKTSNGQHQCLTNIQLVYAVTAANEVESSYATYCGNELELPCLGDEFSVNWMEDSDYVL